MAFAKTIPRPSPAAPPSDVTRIGLDEELDHDLAAAGAERLADPDLADPLLEGREHDVHDHDPADDERDDPGPRKIIEKIWLRSACWRSRSARLTTSKSTTPVTVR
jgi:hypothetical protein